MVSLRSSRVLPETAGRSTLSLSNCLLAFCVCCLIVHARCAYAQVTESRTPVQEVQLHVDHEATSKLISMTQSAFALRENFAALLDATLSGGMRYDDTALSDEMIKRFGDRGWPHHDPYSRKVWAEPLPSARLQALCWLAECNKRLLFGDQEVREQMRAAILKRVQDGLTQASDTDELCGLLDIAYRSVFYIASVTPRDGADEIIDLFKKYVGHDDPAVHGLACDRLRSMGFVWSSRYDEILAFLINNAPQLKEVLTAKPIPGMDIDILRRSSNSERVVEEALWCSLDTMSPADLGAIVEKTLTSWRSQDADGNKALSRLLRESQREDGEPSFQVVRGLLGKGIRGLHQNLWVENGIKM